MEKCSRKFERTESEQKKLDVGGRNCIDAELEEEVAFCVYSMCQKMLDVSRKMIMFKAKKI